MLPKSIRSRIGKYEVEIHGARIKVSVVPEESLSDAYLSEFSQLILKTRLVGMDIKIGSVYGQGLLLIFVETRCLIVQCANHLEIILASFKKILADETICFVGVNLIRKRNYFNTSKFNSCVMLKNCKTWVALGELVAKVLQKPKLLSVEKTSILAGEVGLRAETFSPMQWSRPTPDWGAKVFTEEEILYAIQDAFASHLIAEKALSLIPDVQDVTVKQESG